MKEISKPIYVIGHRNPDTDSICSAIGYAHMKQAMGENAIAARTGKVNAETEFVLDKLGFDKPKLIIDLHPRVKDIMSSEVVTARTNDTLRDLGRMMKEHHVKSVSVVNEQDMLVGVVSVGDFSQLYFDELEMQDLNQTGVDFAGILRVLDGKLICGEELHRKVVGRLHIAAGSTTVIQKTIEKDAIVLVGDRINAQLACLQCGIACLVLTVNAEISPEVEDLAVRLGVVVIKATYDTYTCARLINQSIPVEMIMQKNVSRFKRTDLVSDIKRIIANTNYRLYPVVEKGRVVGAIRRDKLIIQERTKVILVDHNEQNQAVEGIEEAQIIEIIDHHRLGGLQTSEPIFIRHEPVGCTATIVANMHWHRAIDIPANIAGILLAAILSDTVLFKSPTCTTKDIETAEKLATIAGLDAREFGMSVLKAGASIKGMSTADIISNDIKEFQIGSYRIAIGQMSVMESEDILAIKEQLALDMEVMRIKEKYDMVLLMVTNIITEGTHLIYTKQASFLLSQAFGDIIQDGIQDNSDDSVLYLPGVMSRKKQVIPPLSEAVKV